jgi:hypothetical protein
MPGGGGGIPGVDTGMPGGGGGRKDMSVTEDESDERRAAGTRPLRRLPTKIDAPPKI